MMNKLFFAFAALLLLCLPQAANAGAGLVVAALTWRNIAAIVIIVVCLSAMAWMKYKNK